MGFIYEGYATKKGFNGFGRWIIAESNWCSIGYALNNRAEGNCRRYVKGELLENGWFVDAVRVGGFRKDVAKYKYWDDIDEYFIQPDKYLDGLSDFSE